jgi:hypothetical protein
LDKAIPYLSHTNQEKDVNEKELQDLIRKTQKAVEKKRPETQLVKDEQKDLERQDQARKNFVDVAGEKDLLIADAPAEDLFRIMAKRDF